MTDTERVESLNHKAVWDMTEDDIWFCLSRASRITERARIIFAYDLCRRGAQAGDGSYEVVKVAP